MKVVIPVAGAGKRLRPQTHSQPKPLLQVGGKPIIAHLLDPIVKLGPEEVIFVIGYRGQQVRAYVEKNYQFKATFVQQDKLLGLGYAINLAIRDLPPGELLIVLGDTVVECDLQEVIAAGENVLGVLPVDDPERFGIVEAANGQVTRMVEKPEQPKSNMAIIGLYYFRNSTPLKEALTDHIESGRTTRGEVQFTDALQLMLERGTTFIPYEVQEWFDCGKKETMLSTNRHLVSSLGDTPDIAGCKITPPVFIHPEALVSDSEIGPSVSISAGSKVRNSTITNSIIGADSTIEDVRLKDSLVGNEVTLRGNGGRECLVVNLGDTSEVEPG
jgi:glucose-1-phosphate thymidylyltransferase